MHGIKMIEMKPVNHQKLISAGALVALVGFVLSGPVGFLLVSQTKPQPVWVSPAAFVEHYHAIQDVPYYFGFLLIGGMVLLMVAHYMDARDQDSRMRFYNLVALCLATIFSTLIFFNYVCQILFIRNLALHYKPEYDPAIAMFSMANPLSFCWSNEMFGYGILGVATWLLASYYHGRSKFIRLTLIANGIVSLGSVVWTILDANWILTTAGYVGYFGWNLLMITMMIAIYKFARKVS
jgi:hypothetical protein